MRDVVDDDVDAVLHAPCLKLKRSRDRETKTENLGDGEGERKIESKISNNR